MKVRLFCLIIALIFLGADIWLKSFVHNEIPLMHSARNLTYPYGGIEVFEKGGVSFSINHVTNRGAAWGLFASSPKLLLVFRLLMILGLIVYLATHFTSKKTIPLLFVVTGAIGNVLDDFIYGHVVDMFHFTFWGYTYPLFNIADSLIFCGVAALFILSFKNSKRQKFKEMTS